MPITETAFIKGKYVQKFEKDYSAAHDVKHCISCANGTDAIYITLKALGINKMNKSVVKELTPAIKGMVLSINHLLKTAIP